MKWRSLEESAPASEARSLGDIYAERKALISRYVPADIQTVHARVVAELKSSGIAGRSLQAGGDMPQFELLDQEGEAVRSSDLLQNGLLIICFIRGRWCPFCVGQMEAMNEIFPQLQDHGASLIAISPQSVHQNSLTADQHKLRFPVLSDAGNTIAARFGIAYRVPEYQQEIYSRAFVNIPFVNKDDSWQLPIPATYVVQNKQTAGYPGVQGGIVAAFPNPDYTERPEPAAVLKIVEQLRP